LREEEIQENINTNRLLGYNILLNSPKLLDEVYSQLIRVDERIQLHIPFNRSPEDVNWILTVSNGNKKNITNTERSTAVTVADYINIAKQYDSKKSIVIFPTDAGAETCYTFLTHYLRKVKIVVISKTDDDTIITEKLDKLNNNSILVTNIDKIKPLYRIYKPTQIVYIGLDIYSTATKYESRVIRDDIDQEYTNTIYDIDRTIILPIYTSNGKEIHDSNTFKTNELVNNPFVVNVHSAVTHASLYL